MKKIKIITIFTMFIISFISHFAYEIFPNTIFSILFPVNESIWEHMKLLVTPVYITLIIEYIISKKKNIDTTNLFISYNISIIISIILFLITYYIITLFITPNMFIHISLLFISYVFLSLLTYYFSHNTIKINKIISIFILLFIYIVFTYLTYNPFKIDLFYDTKNEFYGIKK